MKEVWLTIITDQDDGEVIITGMFDNEIAAEKCMNDACAYDKAFMCKLDFNEVESEYQPQ
jgi:hypothetical protein